MLYDKSNLEILQALDGYVAGHEEAKKVLINLVNRSKIRYHQRWGLLMHNDDLIAPSKAMLVGASGTGKTHLVESLSKIVNFPLLRFDATHLNVTGASSGVKAEDIYKQIEEKAKLCCYNGSKYHSPDGAIDQMVIFVDEIDKLGRSFDSSGNWNKHVQSNFLSLFDSKDPRYAGLSFIFAGAFTDLTSKRETPSSLGFNPSKNEKSREDIEAAIVKAGLMPELVGRITSIVELDTFTKDDYFNLLKSRFLPKKKSDLVSYGIWGFEIEEDKLREMAEVAHGSEQGIRSLQRQLDKYSLDIEFNYELYRYEGLEELSNDDDCEG